MWAPSPPPRFSLPLENTTKISFGADTMFCNIFGVTPLFLCPRQYRCCYGINTEQTKILWNPFVTRGW